MKKLTINTENLSEEKLEYLIQFLKDCEYQYYVIGVKQEMLQNLGYFICNDSGEHEQILDKLLSYKGDSNNLSEIIPELILWQEVENWSYRDLIGAIQ